MLGPCLCSERWPVLVCHKCMRKVFKKIQFENATPIVNSKMSWAFSTNVKRTWLFHYHQSGNLLVHE